MSRILIIEDEEAIAEIEKDYLELSDFEVVIEEDGEKGLGKALNEDFDLILLDVMLPGKDGFKKDDIDKIRGLGLGADDYLSKPFSPSELVARVKAHIARYTRLVDSSSGKSSFIDIRGIRIDRNARRVFVNDEEKTFTTKTYSGKYGRWSR